MDEILERSKRDKLMAYPSKIAKEEDGGINRAQMEQARLFEEANMKVREREVTGAFGASTSRNARQPATSTYQQIAPRGH